MSVDSQGRTYDKWINQTMSTQGDGTGTTSQIVVVKTITGATTASPTVVTLASHGYSNGDYLFIEGATGTTEINGLRVVAAKTENTFQLTTPAGVAIGSAGTFGGTVTCAPAFVYKPASGKVAILERLVGYAFDATYDGGGYMGISALTNGIEVKWYRNDSSLVTLTAQPVKTWPQWSLGAGVDVGSGDGGAAQKTQALLRWTLSKGGGPLRVDGNQDELIAIIMRDTMTGVDAQEMSIQGNF
jgi:hypothetical protein